MSSPTAEIIFFQQNLKAALSLLRWKNKLSVSLIYLHSQGRIGGRGKEEKDVELVSKSFSRVINPVYGMHLQDIHYRSYSWFLLTMAVHSQTNEEEVQ